MKPGEKQQSEILQAYETWLHAYLNGDVKTYDSYFDDEYRFIGSTNNEEFLNREETTAFFTKTADQLAGKTDLRNNVQTIEEIGGLVFLTHFFDAYFLHKDQWTYYGRFRFSSTMQKKGDGWKLLYQHFSMPDAKSDEGDTIGYDKVTEENQKLREAIQRRTIELESKNRELEVETALEKVRAIALGMKTPEDMLDVCKTISLQLQSLGVKEIRNVQTAIFYPEKGSYMNYEYYAKHKKTFITDTCYTDHEVANAFAEKMLKGRGEVSFTYISGEKKVKEWLDYQKGTNVFIDTFLETVDSLTYYWFSLGPVALGISTYVTLNNDELDLFKRFLNVFGLAYRRYLDIEKAIVQAKEARIEAALEKVRSRSLAMHRSEELQEVVTNVFERLKDLDIETDAINLDVFSDNIKDAYLWTAVPGHSYSREFHIPYNDTMVFQDIYNGMVAGKELHSKVYSREEKDEFLTYVFAHTDFRHIPAERKAMLFATEASTVSVAYAKHIAIVAQRYREKPFSDQENEILKRFAKVFEQAYTRFLDLKKAEAQTKEAQVEASLERIRAKAMAMHQSAELDEVLEVLFDQFDILGIHPMSTHMTLIDVETNTFTFRETGKGGRRSFGEQTVAIDSMDIWKEAADRFKTSDPLSLNILHFPKESLPVVWQVFHESFASMPDNAKIVPEDYPDGIYHTAGNCKFGYIGMNQTRKATPEEEQIVLKFAVEFGRLYQRFLDLQKAEAQTREARIEAALEKVRSSSLAMHKSEELRNVVKVVFDNFQSLGLKNIDSVNINIFHEGSKDFDLWLAAPGQDYTRNFRLPYLDHPIPNDFFEARQKGETLHQKVYAHNVKNAYFKYMFENSDNKNLPEERKQLILQGPAYAVATGIGRHSSIFIHNYSGVPFSYEIQGILVRFTRVFDQTYRRFLDLQKAEAQTREATIETALERVRSKTMAMHNSHDVEDTVATMFEELLKLGVDPSIRCGIGILQDRTHMELWTASSGKNNKVILNKGSLDTTLHPLLSGVKKAWENNESIFTYELAGKDLVDYYTVINNAADYQYHIEMETLPEKRINTDFFFSEGVLFTFTQERLSPEISGIFTRFAGVFGQTYRRFLDLQKAEAQAKESQIQLALERVRARTMAMQRSDELPEAAVVLFQQFAALGETPDRISIGIVDEVNETTDVWATDQAGTGVNIHFKARNNERTTFRKILNDWKAGSRSAIVDLQGDELKDWITYLRTELGIAVDDSYFHGRRIHQVSFFSQGWLNITTLEPLPAATLDLLDRFAAVFTLTYTRFIDLKKAEEQTREAHIELSLERIRARVTAMKVSSDLLDIVIAMRTEFVALGHEAHYFWHMRWLPDIYEKAMTSGDGSRIGNVMTLPHHIHGDIPLIADWENGNEPTVVYAMDAESAVDYIIKMINLGDFERVDPNAPTLDDIRHIGGLTFIMARTTHGEIGYSLPGTVPHPPAEDMATLVRFAGVFDLAYRRFEDLKSSEKQIREAQIELALERVRSKVIGMNHSHELKEISYVFSDQMRHLGVDWQFSYFWLIEEEKDASTFWITWPDNHTSVTAYSLAETDDYTRECLIVWKAGQKMHWNQIPAEGVGHFLETYTQLAHDAGSSAEGVMREDNFKKGVFYYDAMMKYGSFGICTNRPATEEENKIQCRFAIEFERAYTRFLDLKQAEQLARQAEEDLVQLKIEKQRTEEALNELQETQKQLIQSEKMASLGELTAGIAHEIQNPLNFVNNFSEVSNELLDEMVEEVKKGNFEEVQAIVNDVKQNLQKINHHGKRADGIVKGMLQHSRSSSGQKEPTDINALADEYLRLAYHGLRARDKTFNASMKTDYDENIGSIAIIPQDIGRVILNLITNAFYVVNEKKKQHSTGYEPTVTVSTKKDKDHVLITVKDNGSGIPQKVLDKIFQPFFTTKPTGQGTGLGLSLSYDIVKAHSGELKVRTREFEGSEFSIELPIG